MLHVFCICNGLFLAFSFSLHLFLCKNQKIWKKVEKCTYCAFTKCVVHQHNPTHIQASTGWTVERDTNEGFSIFWARLHWSGGDARCTRSCSCCHPRISRRNGEVQVRSENATRKSAGFHHTDFCCCVLEFLFSATAVMDDPSLMNH